MTIGEKDYTDQLSSTYNFVRNRCSALEDINRQVFDRLLKCFKAKSIFILIDQEANIERLRPLGVVGLLRKFESFLERDAEAPKPRGIPPGNRYPQRPFIWRMASSIKHKRNSQATGPTSIQDDLDPTERDLLSQINEHCESSLSQLLERNGDAGRRFQNLRRHRLLLHDESPNSNRTSGITGNTSLPEITPVAPPLSRELPGSPTQFYNQTAPGCIHCSGLFRSSGCFRSQGSFHSPGAFRLPCSCRPATPPP
jgi:hypothetical protein